MYGCPGCGAELKYDIKQVNCGVHDAVINMMYRQ